MGVNKSTLHTLEKVKKDVGFSFSKNTTYGLGGKAKVAYYPNSISQAIAVFDYLTESGQKFVTLGNGSNVLASDKDYNGAVIVTKNLSGIYRTGENTLFCRAGTTVAKLLKYCITNGFGGLEYIAGIPATLGGLIYMNGGAGGRYVAENIVNVKFYDGKIHTYSNKNCRFGNKYSTMRDINCLVLGAEFRFTSESSENIEREIFAYLERRRFHPKGKSCGCVFKNLSGLGAGKLIDEVGLKGLSVGGATVSREHANFIINCGGSSADVHNLINEVKRRVFCDTGVLLEEELVYIGDFNDTVS